MALHRYACRSVGGTRENHVVEFEEGRRIAWKPAYPGEELLGHLWRWELEPGAEPGVTLVRHSYDWSGLPDTAEPKRLARACKHQTPGKRE